MEDREASKVRDISFYVNKIIEDKIEYITVISKLLKQNPNLQNSLNQYEENGDLGSLKKTIDDFYLTLSQEIDFFMVTDRRGKVVYQNLVPAGGADTSKIWGLEEALTGEDIVETGYGPQGWAIRTLTPLYREGKPCGVLILGVRLDDTFAQKIGEATKTHISFSTPYQFLASSWPPAQRQEVEIPWIIRSVNEKRSFFRLDKEKNISSFYVPMDIGDETVCLVVNTDTTPISNLLEKKRRHLFLSFLGVLGVILGIGSGLTFSIVKPLRNLHQRAIGVIREFSGEDLPVTRGGNEVETLSQAMEVMLAAIQARLTDIEAAHEALQESEKKYRLLVNQIPAVVFRGYADGNIDTFDRKIETLTGYPKEDFDSRRRKWSDLILEEDLPQAKDKFLKGLKTTGTYEREYRVRQKSGEIIWVQVQGRIFLDATGTIDYVSGVISDVTARKVAEEALLKYEFIANTAKDCMTLIDRNYLYEAANAAYCQAHGKTREEVLGQSAADIWGQDTFNSTIKSRLDQCFTGQAVEYEGWFPFGQRGMGCYRVSYNPYFNADGTVAYAAVVSHDITDRKQAEEALRQSEKRFKDIADNALQWVWEVDAQGKYTYSSPMVEQLLGYKPEDILNRYFYDFFHPDDREEEKNAALAFFSAKVPFRGFLNRNLHKDGSIVWLLTSGTPILDDQGNLLGYRGVDTDITERLQAEEAVRERESMLSLVINTVPQVIFWKDLNSVYLGCNQNYARAAGLETPAAIVGKTEHDLPWRPEEIENYLAEDREVMQTRRAKLHRVESRRLADGREIWVDGTKMPLLAGDDNVMGVLGVYEDITDRKRMEAELQESELRFRGLVENVPMGIMIIQDGALVYQNPEQERLFGHLHIQTCHDLLICAHRDDLSKAEQFCQGITANLSQADISLRFIPFNSKNPEKGLIWVNCRGSVIEYRGQKAMLVIMVDITRTKDLEFLMLIREKMASLGQVAAGIAHEIRNPLSGINVFLESIKEIFQDPENAADVVELIEAAQATSNKIEGVIRRVLDFSRPAELKLAPSDINLAVDDAIKLSATKLRKDNVRIDSSLAANLPLVYADKQLLEQTIINMITNAAEAVRGTGEPGYIHIATQASGDAVLITIKDSGPGIPPALRDKIFDPFFTTKSDGSGIGLSLCQRIIADHGGNIEVSSSDLGGTQFVIRLPREKRGSG